MPQLADLVGSLGVPLVVALVWGVLLDGHVLVELLVGGHEDLGGGEGEVLLRDADVAEARGHAANLEKRLAYERVGSGGGRSIPCR